MAELVAESVEAYAAAHSTRVVPLLDELWHATHERTDAARMLSGPVVGRLLQALIALSGTRRVLEIGTFTGYSALMMAEALPDEGRIMTCDVDADSTAIAREFWARSPHGHKIELCMGPALETLGSLEGPFGVAFIDADKTGYAAYYEAVLPKLDERGVIVFDNALQGGRVLDDGREDENARAIAELNARLAVDERVVSVLLTVRDGLMLVRRR